MTAPGGEEKASIEVSLEDRLSAEAAAAGASADEMTKQLKQLNRQLLMLDKRSLKAAGSVAALDAAMAGYHSRASKVPTVTKDVEEATKKYGRELDKQEKRLTKTTKATKKADKETKKFTDHLKNMFKIVNFGAPGLQPMTLLMIGLGTAIAGAIAPSFQLGAALSSLAGLTVALPSLIGTLVASFATISVATKGVSQAFGTVLGYDWTAFYMAILQLAPAAQKFFEIIRKYRTQLITFRKTVQQAFFGGFVNHVEQLFTTLLPKILPLMSQLAGTIGQTIGGILDFFVSSKGVQLIQTIFHNAQNFWDNIKKVAVPILSGFAAVVTSVSTEFDKMTNTVIGKWGTQFANWLQKIASNGKAAMWLKQAMVMGGQLVDLLRTAGRILLDISKAAGGMSFSPLMNVLKMLEKWTSSTEGQSALTTFFSSLRVVMAALSPILNTVLDGIGGLIPIIATIITTLAPYLNTVLKQIGDVLASTAPMWGDLAKAVGQVLIALTPLLPLIGQLLTFIGPLLSNVLQMLAPILQVLLTVLAGPLMTLFQALGMMLKAQAPFITKIVESMSKAFSGLAPILDRISKEFLGRFMQFIQRMIPLWEKELPLWEKFAEIIGQQLLVAFQEIEPMLPQLFDAFFQLLNIFADPNVQKSILLILTALIKITTFLTGSFLQSDVAVIGVIIQLVTWIVRLATWGFKAAYTIGTWVGMIIGFFMKLDQKIVDALTPIADAISKPFLIAFQLIKDAWDRTIGGLSVHIPDIPGVPGRGQTITLPKLEEGGPAMAGQQYLVGEVGKELFVPGNGGNPFLIGEGGPEIRTFSDSGFVIPNHMVKAMEKAGDGMMAELARMETRADANEAMVIARTLERVGAGGGSHEYHIDQHFHGTNMTPDDVDRAVRRAMRAIERDRKERS